MPPPVIKVESLSKRYRIGLKEKRKDTFFGQIGSTLRAPLDNFRQLRSLSRFNEDDESVFWALRDINFEVHQGEVLGIIGHNGAGKSTLLKILSRITEPTDGRITVTGRIGALLEVGTGFHPELTGRDNIYMNGTILGMTRREIDRKLDEIVDFSGVEKYIDTPVKFYSSGMKVRLGFAVAAHLEPEILVIDEVLAVGDANFQKKCLGKMRHLSSEGRTVLFVSHDMGAISNLTSSCICLKNGKILVDSDTEITIKEYLKHGEYNYSGKKFNHIENLTLEITSQDQNNKLPGIVGFGMATIIKGNFYSKSEVKSIAIFLRIENNIGEVISTISTRDTLTRVDLIKNSEQKFSYQIEHFNLTPGGYFITFAIQNSFGEVIDVSYNHYFFEIINENIPDRLKKKSDKQGKVYLFGKWKV